MKLEKDVRNAIAALLVRIIYAEDVIDAGKFEEAKKVIEKHEQTAENVEAGRIVAFPISALRQLYSNSSLYSPQRRYKLDMRLQGILKEQPQSYLKV